VIGNDEAVLDESGDLRVEVARRAPRGGRLAQVERGRHEAAREHAARGGPRRARLEVGDEDRGAQCRGIGPRRHAQQAQRVGADGREDRRGHIAAVDLSARLVDDDRDDDRGPPRGEPDERGDEAVAR
jgi:hypothetical protein